MGLFGETLGILLGDKVIEGVDKALSSDLAGKVLDPIMKPHWYVIVKGNKTLKKIYKTKGAVWVEGITTTLKGYDYFGSKKAAKEFAKKNGLDLSAIDYHEVITK